MIYRVEQTTSTETYQSCTIQAESSIFSGRATPGCFASLVKLPSPKLKGHTKAIKYPYPSDVQG